MNVLSIVLTPVRLIGPWLRGSLLGRYVRALSSSARISLSILGGLLVAIFGLSAFSSNDIEVDATPEAIPVVARPAQLQSLSPEIHVFGRVENPNTTALRAATLAYVTEVNVREGQKVAAGDLLLRLDDRDAQLSVRRFEAALTEAQGEYDRMRAQQVAESKNTEHQRRLFQLTVNKQERFETLFSKGQISATDYDALEQQRLEMEMALNQQEMLLANQESQRASADARVIRAETDLQESMLNLERLSLLAPFDGTVIQIDAAIGARIDAGQTVMSLFNVDSQQVRVSLPERDANALHAAISNGQSIRAAARVAEEWIALDLLDIGAHVRSGRAGTDVLFASPLDSELALGRAVDVRITLPAQANLIEVPLQSVYADRIMYIVENNRLKSVDVERVGIREDAQGKMSLLIRADGLREGEPLVVSSLSRAGSGARVKVLGAQEPVLESFNVLDAPEVLVAR
ncbi:MAG: multidrug efflux pump subunit AcrA (membrane-fusion protein) [Glaciecola sp.]|jgi:multidrug efflux pump subunit AcrA (membrane-fusion protein)|uniref:efflux RND transporter periplasmic adaptor subunit n=1 Tax=Congregibacter sp. TaxID=2744308 RepID=UPI0039E31A06